MRLRQARSNDAQAVTEVWLKARRAAAPFIPEPIHSGAEVFAWIAEVVLPTHQTWVAVDDMGRIAAMMSLLPGWIEQLYVDPAYQSHGVGSLLLQRAKERSPKGLELWTFVSNTGAGRFYERHGFLPLEETDGRGNEEQSPDIRYRWLSQQP